MPQSRDDMTESRECERTRRPPHRTWRSGYNEDDGDREH